MTNSSVGSSTGVAELFHMLESNKLSDVEEIKKVFHDHFLSTKDNWLVNGLFDYYLSTNSLRAVEVLAGVREPHDKHLFDKLNETLVAKSTNNEHKVRTLTLLGHIARRQPTWLYKLASHTLFKQLLHLLKVEEDIVLLMSALLLLISLLPMLPTALAPHLHEIFEVFSRLASLYYHCFLYISSMNPTRFATVSPLNVFSATDADQYYRIHLQHGLQNLFHRLYAMYPCNFVFFLKQQYLQRDQLTIFKKIISPFLDSVRMHPLLVTMSKESEISSLRWKKMEHHDVVAECGRFSLLERSSREEPMLFGNLRYTPVLDDSGLYTLISTIVDFPMVAETTGFQCSSQESFWSPSMVVCAHSPPPPSSLQATPISHEVKSTPSTPGVGASSVTATGTLVNNRSRTSPPEAAVEATPETTPVKDLRQIPSRQMPVGSAAVRALSGFGNGAVGLLNSSRPSTPTPVNQQHQQLGSFTTGGSGGILSDGNSILDRKLGKIAADRHNALHQEQTPTPTPTLTPTPTSTTTPTLTPRQLEDVKRTFGTATATPLITTEQINTMLNGKVDNCQHQQIQLEDQEVSDIVSLTKSTTSGSKDFIDKDRQSFNDLSRKVRLKFYCKYPTPPVLSSQIRRRAKSCPNIAGASSESSSSSIGIGTFRPLKMSSTSTEEVATQTSGLVPYECFFLDMLDQRPLTADSTAMATTVGHGHGSEARLSPGTMLDRYIELCARSSAHPDSKSRSRLGGRRSRLEEESENGGPQHQQSGEESGETPGSCWAEMDRANQQIQLMQMQLQFERQRREVHAERNRRLLGKLRDSRALEELNSAMTNRLKLAENEIETLKSELSLSNMEARTGENKLLETIHHCQTKYKEEQQQNAALKDRIEHLQDELKNEKKKVMDHEKQTRAAEATLFEAAHQLKEALRAANQSEELKRVLDAVQKRFILLGEAQGRIQEKMGGPIHMAKQEAAQIQRSWSEEVYNLRRQFDSQTLQLESLRSHLAELEHKDARKEVQLVDQQRLLQESKEKHSAELEAVESKYRAQLEINLLLEGRILELHGKLEQATYGVSAAVNLASSASPKERSPPLSASLASSSEGSLAFIQSAMNDCCDPGGEIANLQAIVEPSGHNAFDEATTTQR
ncbi:PREDICTED: hamartin [Ceratosolen solmsi marchali]|uniref:Hamartin n=1 Tax=Ceratosolen solmsi marchali TaxID=326594 RepID=A0AAJ6VLX2_9HYME|nr:PREDICTED: hamartin [Ceratosolen solmsi marchali]XP_011495437.1 PREDICTED: hamartin [Ceratosolen solmsi marchali]XP_011495438.1 PREDICTED: hamartin [Ceratosolen solmsi marchali]XP_011495439.1 PREDICTED: hamartin [Ceratosolen solmsi marchali]